MIGAEGTLFRTKTNELSVRVERLLLLTKSLRPLPDKWHGIADTELRYRRRYVDLIMNEDSRRVFETRSAIVRYLRAFLDARGFLEVETPMLHPIPGGAAARPFKTHHNALDADMYLRIAPELYLKRLTVGGFERVYEINRNFRNEGVSTQHNPEFTMLELYQAYADYTDLMEMMETLFQGLADTLLGSRKLVYQGTEIDLSQSFARMSIEEIILANNPDVDPMSLRDVSYLRRVCDQMKIASQGRRTAPANCKSRFSRKPANTPWCSPPSRMPIPRRCRPCRGATMRIPSSPIAGNFSSAAANSPTDSRS